MAIAASPVEELTDEEAQALFDAHAHRYLGLSGEEFLAKYDAGEYEGLDEPDVTHMVALIALVR